MKKKIISILLAVALVAGLLAVPALAEGEPDTGVYIAGVQLEVNKPYYNADFWPLIPAPDTTPDPSPTPTYEPSPTPTYSPAPTPAPSPTSTGYLESASAVYGGMTRSADSQDWNAKLEGDAANGYTLTIKDLSVMGVANMNNSAAIYSEHDLTIVLKGVNSAISEDGDLDWSVGIYVDGDLTIEGSGTLTTTSGNTTGDNGSDGIFADTVTITGGATVIATGGTAPLLGSGIWGRSVNIADATVVATGGSTGGSSYGICAEEVNITDATVIATGGNTAGASYGIRTYDQDIAITSSTVVARAGTVGGGFSGDRGAFDGSVSLTGAKLAGAVANGTEQDTPDAATATSLAIVPDSWTRNALPKADDNTYTLNDDTYIVSVDTYVLEIDSDTTIDVAEGKTLLAVSLFEGEGDTAGICSTASVTLNGSIIAVGGLASASDEASSSAGFKVPDGAQGQTVTINGSLLAIGAGTPNGDGIGYASRAGTTVSGALMGVGVSGANTYGLNMQGDLTVNSGGAALGYAGPAGASESTAAGIFVKGTISAGGTVTGVGPVGLSGEALVDGGSYLGKTSAVGPLASTADGCAFYNADGEVPEDPTDEQYLTVGKRYTVIFHTNDVDWELKIPDGKSVAETYENAEELLTTGMEKSGYTFLGWYESEDEGETFSDGPFDFDAPITADMNLYPRWSKIVIPPVVTPPTDEPTDEPPCPQDHTCPIAPFDDADPKAWYHDGVHYCIEGGLMIGTGETEFQPHAPTTRATIVTILHRLAGEPEATTGGTFADVADGLWYTEAVEWAAANGIVEGDGESFYPEADLTREQAATILYRYVQYLGGGFTGAWAFRLDFADLAEMNEWAYEGVSWCVMNGIIEGDDNGLLRPGDGLERCEMATLVYRLCEDVLK